MSGLWYAVLCRSTAVDPPGSSTETHGSTSDQEHTCNTRYRDNCNFNIRFCCSELLWVWLKGASPHNSSTGASRSSCCCSFSHALARSLCQNTVVNTLKAFCLSLTLFLPIQSPCTLHWGSLSHHIAPRRQQQKRLAPGCY